MSTETNLLPLEIKVLERKLYQFFSGLTPEERRLHPIFGAPKGMCSEGEKIYQESSLERSDKAFPSHYMEGKCPQCKGAFLKYLFMVTD